MERGLSLVESMVVVGIVSSLGTTECELLTSDVRRRVCIGKKLPGSP